MRFRYQFHNRRQPLPWNYFLLARYTEIISNVGRHPSKDSLWIFSVTPGLRSHLRALGFRFLRTHPRFEAFLQVTEAASRGSSFRCRRLTMRLPSRVLTLNLANFAQSISERSDRLQATKPGTESLVASILPTTAFSQSIVSEYKGLPYHDTRYSGGPCGCIAQAWSVAEILRVYFEDVRNLRPNRAQVGRARESFNSQFAIFSILALSVILER